MFLVLVMILHHVANGFDYTLVWFETLSGCRCLGMLGVQEFLAKTATQHSSSRFAKAWPLI